MLSVAIDMEFQQSYNNENNVVYKKVESVIKEQAKKHISSLQKAELNEFQSGSTIALYSISATSFNQANIENLETGIFLELKKTFRMLFIEKQKDLQFKPPKQIVGQSTTLTCGPPPESLNFGTDWEAEWRNEDVAIKDSTGHLYSQRNSSAVLSVSNFFSTDNGSYECRITSADGQAVYRQTGMSVLQEAPLLTVTPIVKNVKCKDDTDVRMSLNCSVNDPYEVQITSSSNDPGNQTEWKKKNVSLNYTIPKDCNEEIKTFICKVRDHKEIKTITLKLSEKEIVCRSGIFGDGAVDDTAKVPCTNKNEVGEITAVCRNDTQWEETENNCILQVIKVLLDQSKFLNDNSLPEFLDQLSNVTLNSTKEVIESPRNIEAIVQILNNVANQLDSFDLLAEALIEDVLITVSVLTINKTSWDTLNSRDTSKINETRTISQSVSSLLLESLENITGHLNNQSFNLTIDRPHPRSILLNKTTFSDTFSADYNSSVEVEIPESPGGDISQSITVLTFATMDNVLPARDEQNSTTNLINGRIVLVRSSGRINNISFTFDTINDTLRNPQCVFWNFSLFNGLGGWDDQGCTLVFNENNTVNCNCDHVTSFSLLMSPSLRDDPALAFITFIGVGISIASLIICLIIEAVVWRKIRRNNTSYLRHVSIVNIAVSLLIANIWFIIGAAVSEQEDINQKACATATFFVHLFYLALFFWMLASALLLFYRTVNVFDSGLSRSSKLAIGFSLGYGAPLIIAIITIAVTAPNDQYTRATGYCWLNWYESKALLAFVIPALLIVAINFLIMLVVIYKMLRRRADSGQADERHVLVVIIRSLAILTPIFGLTWSLGVGTMVAPENRGIHVAFALFNSLQGFFILVFGTLLDKKVRSEIAIKSQTSAATRSTSAGNSSSGGLAFLRNLRRRDVYNISSGPSGESHSVSNT